MVNGSLQKHEAIMLSTQETLTAIHISEPPPWLQSNVPFKTYSTYYNAGNFYTINHNAINKKVGDGLREGETDDRDAEHGDTEEEEDGEYECWQNLHFDWNSNFCSSYARMAGAYPRLYAQREDQSWAKMLLPETYHAEPPNWTTDRRYGAFNGDLPLVLSLVAFSFPAAQMSTLFEASFQGSRWRLPTNGPHGRIDKRGIVVDVWPYGSTTIHDLRELEGGVYGPMFY
ncbi:hypothetical protein M501DRAFT_989787 [Patellaria atrata CBS 101060]|uniref:Uncharacterized protein n=1 Tax=Patellaria atrata CBS 101060 TaxID=1346257 RepID=A0A9P4SFA3_9PEZI|nr:hypothetical protein M501DRAFT_989787 [Patellaria atrata CBS 101060]